MKLTSAMEHESSSDGDFDLWTEETVDIETPFSNLGQNDSEYLKLEITELKQLLISLAEKYKLSEDRRKVAEKRNAILKADNERLQQMSDTYMSQKIEAEVDNRKTLDKLREFIDFRADFEKQAELLKKIIGHLPKMKNASTTTRVPVDEKCEQVSFTIRDDNQQTDDVRCDDTDIVGSGDNNEVKPLMTDTLEQPDDIKCEMENQSGWINKLNDEMLKDNGDVQAEEEYTWNYNKVDEEETTESKVCLHHDNRQCKSKIKLARLKQEVIALKNLNDWKTSDLDYKNRQLIIKSRELMHANKEMTQLKMKISKLLMEKQKRYFKPFFYESYNRASNYRQSPNASKIKTIFSQVLKDKKVKDQTIKKDCKADKRCKEWKSECKTMEDNLAVSREKVWKEIAPGDQVKIKLKKHSLSDGNLN